VDYVILFSGLFIGEKMRHKFISTSPGLFLHLLRNFLLGIVLIFVALYAGMLGYHVFENLPWVDAYLNASMILGGMGPVNTLHTTAGKIFAGSYALFSGLAFIAIVALMLSPVIHKVFRKIHLEGKQSKSD
jgi:hypothetical protein